MAETLRQLLAELEKRPEMYLGNDLSIARLGAFINGWLLGAGQHISNTECVTLSDFTDFVASKFEIPNSYGWEAIITLAVERGASDVEGAFALFNEFFGKYDRNQG